MTDSSVVKHVSFCSMLGDRVFELVFFCCHIFIWNLTFAKGGNCKTLLLNEPHHQRVPRSPCGDVAMRAVLFCFALPLMKECFEGLMKVVT